MAESESAPPGASAAPAEQAEPSFDFMKSYERSRAKSCKVAGISLVGNTRTKDHIILRELPPALLHGQTLDEIKDGLIDACDRLTALDAFSSVDVLADKSAQDIPNAADVVVTVTEKPVLSLHTGTFVQGDEGSLEVSAKLNNALGYLEQLEAHGKMGNQHSVTCELVATQQRLFGGSTLLEGRLGQTTRSFQRHSSFSEQLRGISASLVSGAHTGEYELAWRQLTDPSRSASNAIREHLGHSLKSSLKHTYKVDHRDNPFRPTAGWALRTTSELAGVGPSDLLRFCRFEAETVAVTPLTRGVALALSLRGGILLPWGGSAGGRRPATHISDRFFLGGPDSLRGFCTKGAGPSDARRPVNSSLESDDGDRTLTRDALGGDLLCSTSAAVTFELPHATLRNIGLFGQVFVNAGTVLPLSGPGAARSIADVTESMRTAAGAGIVLPTRIGRLEVNYCVTLRVKEHDRPKRGVQFGLRPFSL